MASVNSQSTRVLLIEDDEGIAEPLIFGLKSEGFQVSYAGTGAAGLAIARTEHPDVILPDVMLPDMDGFSVCRTVRGESATPVLMLTARGQEMDRVMGLELGADDYIVKPFSFRELLARVRAVVRRRELDRGEGLSPVEQLTVGNLLLDRTARQVRHRGRPLELSPREFDLLAFMMEHMGEALSRQELLDRVWGQEWIGNPRTLDVHVRWLREKIEEDSNAPRYIQTVRGHGYRFADPDHDTQ
ncbi:MAG: response regulator transcription factor [Chloroflexi bacterium]|nr:response regulator transcription factor [Chloroflexota bacterium]